MRNIDRTLLQRKARSASPIFQPGTVNQREAVRRCHWLCQCCCTDKLSRRSAEGTGRASGTQRSTVVGIQPHTAAAGKMLWPAPPTTSLAGPAVWRPDEVSKGLSVVDWTSLPRDFDFKTPSGPTRFRLDSHRLPPCLAIATATKMYQGASLSSRAMLFHSFLEALGRPSGQEGHFDGWPPKRLSDGRAVDNHQR